MKKKNSSGPESTPNVLRLIGRIWENLLIGEMEDNGINMNKQDRLLEPS